MKTLSLFLSLFIVAFFSTTIYGQYDTVLTSELQLNVTSEGRQYFSRFNDTTAFNGYILRYFDTLNELTNKQQTDLIEKIENGKVIYQKKFYKSGKLLSFTECNFLGEIPNGEYKEWHENGQLKTQGKYKKGKKIGKWKHWKEDGKPN